MKRLIWIKVTFLADFADKADFSIVLFAKSVRICSPIFHPKCLPTDSVPF